MLDPAVDPAARAKQVLLAQLAEALAILADRLRAQERNMAEVCMLGARAEEIAGSARLLGVSASHDVRELLMQLAQEIEFFAGEFHALVARVREESLPASELAQALTEHSTELAGLTEVMLQPGGLEVVKEPLLRLVDNLATLPHRLRAGQRTSDDLSELARQASAFSSRAEQIAAGHQRDLRESVIRLSRDLRDFADRSAEVAAKMTGEAKRAMQAAEAMACRTRDMALGSSAGGARMLAVIEQGQSRGKTRTAGQAWEFKGRTGGR